MSAKTLIARTTGLCLLSVIGVADAALISVPMDLSSWSYYREGGGGGVEQSAGGIKFYGSGYRQGAAILANFAADFSNATVYIKWMANGGVGNSYMGVNPMVGNVDGSGWIGYTWMDMTTHHSWTGSVVIPEDTWLYTRLDVNPDRTWRGVTATGNYDDLGGTVFNNKVFGPMLQSDWHFVQTGRIGLVLGDNYSGTAAWMLVGEAKYDIAAAPEPGTLALAVIRLAGLARRKGLGSGRV